MYLMEPAICRHPVVSVMCPICAQLVAQLVIGKQLLTNRQECDDVGDGGLNPLPALSVNKSWQTLL